MKKIIIIILIIITNSLICYAQNTTIDQIENSVFGYSYSNEADTKRIERIESYLYGSKKTGNIKKRIENIQNDIGFVSQEEKTLAIKQQQEEKRKKEIKNNLTALPEDSSVEYPMVDKLETELFNTTYKNENIYQRLDRLETQVFQKTSTEPLTNRVDKLSDVILPKKKFHRSEDNYSQQELDNYYRSNGLAPIDNQAIPFQLAVLEEDLFKNNYEQDNIANRLNRLEEKLFNRRFSNDSDTTRLQRIMVAYDAKQKSYKYENNKRMQNMATASQIGGILLMILAMIL